MGRRDPGSCAQEETGEMIEQCHHRQRTHSVIQPRKLFVQPNTFIVNDEVVLKEYSTTPEGVLESFIERSI